MADLLAAALAAGDPAARTSASSAYAASVAKDVKVLKATGAVEALKAALEGTDAVKRESALAAVDALAQSGGVAAEPYVISLLSSVLERCADKVPSVRTVADATVRTIGATVNPDSLKRLLPTLFDGMASARQWQTKEAALGVLKTFVERAPLQMCASLTEVVPKVSECMWDTRPTVITTATATMTAVCSVVGNRDLEAFLPIIVACIAKPTEVPDCIHKLSATVFVQEVETPALAIMVPLLERGLRERQTAIKRKTALIIDNMCKLVEDPTAAAPFLPKLLPGLERLAAEVADPECRIVCSKAQATLILAAGGKDASDVKRADEKAVQGVLVEQVTGKCDIDEFVSMALDHVASLCTFLSDRKCFDFDTWNKKAVTPYISSFVAADVCEAAARALLARCIEDTRVEKEAAVDDDEGEDLCNCEFSLAYGGKILLNNATLWLKRGRRYGLCGPNGAGKSTLMKAIANGQLEGFPPPEILKTVYVEHDIQGELADLNVIEYVFADPKLAKESREEVVRVLSSVGFTDKMQTAGVTSLSGGWKMKLALARAMLTRADIFLLDEPTNHLDVKNVAWIENFLIGLKNVTCMLVSHDSGFLDRVCTDIIHYENRKLKRYKGNLSEFVKQKPEARSYYELSAATIKFTFPEPGFLEGVKTKDKGILKMTRVGFKYPTAKAEDRMIVQNVSIYCSLSTRVAIHGANGAGKSTMIKLLTGELEPLEGTVWKHPNLRMAYVAQHAFHHIEEHLDKTPNQYIQWRYALGEDREEAEKVYRQVSKEEEEKMAVAISINGVKVVVELLLGRRKLKNSYEYEVQWIGLPPDKNMWLPRSQLEAMGFGKMVRCDAMQPCGWGLPLRMRSCSSAPTRRAPVSAEGGPPSHRLSLIPSNRCKRSTPRRLRAWACTRAR